MRSCRHYLHLYYNGPTKIILGLSRETSPLRVSNYRAPNKMHITKSSQLKSGLIKHPNCPRIRNAPHAHTVTTREQGLKSRPGFDSLPRSPHAPFFFCFSSKRTVSRREAREGQERAVAAPRTVAPSPRVWAKGTVAPRIGSTSATRRPSHGGSCRPSGRHRRLRPRQHGRLPPQLPSRAPRRPCLRHPLLPGHGAAPPHSTGAMSPSRQCARPDPAWLPVSIILSVACISPSAMGVHEVAEDPLQHGTWCLNRYAEDPSKLSGTQHQFTC